MNRPLADTLIRYDASGLAEQIRLRTLSAVEVMQAHFERIRQFNAECNAFVTLDEQRALRRAKEADDALMQGTVWGPLHGVPISIKDALETAGLRTTAGYEGYSDTIPDRDAWVVDKLKNAGAIVIGKTNCATLCADIQTTNKLFGATNNPWRSERTSGGSSGGEAVAVALGMSPLGIGSDTAGSIRIPSSYCGVFGLRTSFAKIPTDGLLPLRNQTRQKPDGLTVIGPMARSLRDIELCHSILTGDPVPPETPTKPKVFWTRTFSATKIDDEVAQVINAKLSPLLGDIVAVDSPLALEELFAVAMRLSLYEFQPEQTGRTLLRIFRISETLRSLFRGGAATSYAKLKRRQAELSSWFEEFMSACDCWVLPATPSTAFAHRRIGAPIPLTITGRRGKHGYWPGSMGFSLPISLLGNPSISIPIGKAKDGLPIAIQVVGRKGEDMKLLRAAAYLVEKTGTFDLQLAEGDLRADRSQRRQPRAQ